MPGEGLLQLLQSSGMVPGAKAAEITSYFRRKAIGKNEFFLKEGMHANEYLYLEKGFMRAFVYDPGGNDVTTGFFSAGQMVFEVSSFFNRTISQENIQALADCEGLMLTYDELNMLFHSMPEFRDFGRSILVKGFSALKNRMLSTITETAEERYAALMMSQPEIFQQAALKHIASYLGITDTSLSRIRREFAKK